MEYSQQRSPGAAGFNFKDGFLFGLGFFTAGLIFTIVIALVAALVSGFIATSMDSQFVDIRERAYVSAMKSDLRNLAAAEEAHFADHLTYTTELSDLDFNASQGVTVTIWESSDRGWRAIAEHSGTGAKCEIYYGSGIEPTLASTEGVVECS